MSTWRLTLVALVGGLMLSGMAASAWAQQDGGADRRAEFRQRMEQRLKEQLGVNDDEWKVLQPKIEKVSEARRAQFSGFGGGFGGRRGGGDERPQTPVAKAQADLRSALENKDTPAAEITRRLTALREAREKARQDLAAAQKDLKEVLTARQEAVLVVQGTLE